MTDKKKTHEERIDPQISINRLADYMGSSEQVKRRIVASCKYRPIVPVIQHGDAKQIIGEYLCSSDRSIDHLRAELERLEARICDSMFEESVKKHNCDYLQRFIAVAPSLNLPAAEYALTDGLPKVTLNGTRVSFYPQARLSRITRRNVQKSGALILRYAKTRPLREEVALYESAFMFGYLAKHTPGDEGVPEHGICLTVDCYAGRLYQAPGDAKYRFKEMEAVCIGIAERWPAIKPPPGAVL